MLSMMQSVRNSCLNHLRVRVVVCAKAYNNETTAVTRLIRRTNSSSSHDQILDRVICLVKKFDKIEAAKVTETTDFQKDLSLDSLDKVELVMAFEQEFSIEIPDDKADMFSCCADVARYIISVKADEIS